VIRSGWRSALPRRLVLVAAALLIPVVAGCEAGNDAPTLQFHYPTDTAGYPPDTAGSTAMGNLAIRNVFILGAPIGHSLHKGQSASLFLALVNDGAPDKLISITAPGSATSVSLPGGGVPVTDGHPVFLTGPRPQVVLVGLTRTLASGSSIRLDLTFQKAGTITLLVPVMPHAVQYQTFAPPQATQTTTASPPSPSPGAATPSATPTTTPQSHSSSPSPSSS
jgi:copper(I)-binding protein